jgi:hypothetical protein
MERKYAPLNSVLVKFEDSKYNYSTSIGAKVTEPMARKYFIGKSVNVGTYPKEKFVEVKDIEYTKGKHKANSDANFGHGGAIDDVGNPTDKAVLEEMEAFIDKEIPKLDDKVYFTYGMKRKEAKRRFYEKNHYGAYHPKFAMDFFEKGGNVSSNYFSGDLSYLNY